MVSFIAVVRRLLPYEVVTDMGDIKEALEKLTKADMHVKLIKSDLTGIFITPIDTHYIMQGADVVHVGNEKTIISFALRLAV